MVLKQRNYTIPGEIIIFIAAFQTVLKNYYMHQNEEIN